MMREFDKLRPCPICGGKGVVNQPSYANEHVSVFCMDCDASTNSYVMEIYCEGTHRAISDWNNNKIFPQEVSGS